MITVQIEKIGGWKNDDLLKVKEVYKDSLKKERLLLSQGQVNFLQQPKVPADLTQDIKEFDGLIAKISEELQRTNPH